MYCWFFCTSQLSVWTILCCLFIFTTNHVSVTGYSHQPLRRILRSRSHDNYGSRRVALSFMRFKEIDTVVEDDVSKKTNTVSSTEREDTNGEEANGVRLKNDFFSSTNRKFQSSVYDLLQASSIAIVAGSSVSVFKSLIELLRTFSYEQSILVENPYLLCLIPALGGAMVSVLQYLLVIGGAEQQQKFLPGLQGEIVLVDKESLAPYPPGVWMRTNVILTSMRKSAAAVATLGTGSSLGPEGPCVEIGLGVARACQDNRRDDPAERQQWNRVLLSCGAAAGVAAGFDAPVAGVFFALEVMQNAFQTKDENDGGSSSSSSLFSKTSNITPVLLASTLSALVSNLLLEERGALKLNPYDLPTPLLELPMYLALGVMAGIVAFLFSQTAKWCKSFFSGEVGGEPIQTVMGETIPNYCKPVMGGMFCGVLALFFPQILFFGYETLNALLGNASIPTAVLVSLLGAKIVATAVAAGSGLVGGTFAPSLFMGAMLGTSFHNVVAPTFCQLTNAQFFELADQSAYSMVGAASVLAALFRAPLTASLLLFELTRDYDVILPLMASSGVGSMVGDLLDDFAKEWNIQKQENRRDQDSVSWGDLAD